MTLLPQIKTQAAAPAPSAHSPKKRPAPVDGAVAGQLDTLFTLIKRATGATHVSLQMGGTGPQALPEGLGACLQAAVMRDKAVLGILRAYAPQSTDFHPCATEMLEDSATLAGEQMALWTAARVDALTGAMARGAFTESLEQRIAAHRRTGEDCSLIMLDLDHFKSFNDLYGHAVGDEVLRCVADSIRAQLRIEDSFGRLGGEEFAVVVRGDCDAAREVAERLRSAVLAAEVPEHLRGKVSASFGVASCSVDCSDADTLMIDADTQLYRAKRGGRNRVCAGSPSKSGSVLAN